MTRVTQKTVAEKLGLSPSLVSRALSGKAEAIGCTEETVARIIQTAHAMGYIPSAAARQLRGDGGLVIGVVIADVGDPFFSQVMTEVIRQSHARGCALAVAGFDRRIIDRRDLSVLLEQDLAGLLMIGSAPVDWMEPLARRGHTLVRIGPVHEATPVHQIGPDEANGFRTLVRHLKALGHRHIGFVGADLDVHRDRLETARLIAIRAGLNCPVRHIALGSGIVLQAGLEGGHQLMQQAGKRFPSAIICSSDTVAMGVLSVLAANGRRVPDEVSVTGFDDLVLSRLTTPPLTTLHQPVEKMTQRAIDLIIKGKSKPTTLRLPLELIQRGSTGRTT
jgi:LacI family transcriptional regulator